MNGVVRFLWPLICVALSLRVAAADTKPFTIGYLELQGDPRYEERQTRWRLQGQPWGRPFEGARLALKESRFPARAADVTLHLRRERGKTAEELLQALQNMREDGVRFFLVDATGPVVGQLAREMTPGEALLLNVSALDDALRGTECTTQMLHLVPSRAMLADALGQVLVAQKWTKVLLLTGPRHEDKDVRDAFLRTAKRLGLKVVEERQFNLGRDPRQRYQNNVALLTSRADYDVVFVADGVGDLAREVPYQTQRPRPVLGGAGLVADWWHWAWERHGAPQLNDRFHKRAKRHMTGYDWAAWMGVKAVVEALLRIRSTDFETLSDYILGPEIILDGFKGNRLSFREWNGQLRQPVFATTGNWVALRTPLEGFLHPVNNLDTLGFDHREVNCQVSGKSR